MMEEANFMFYIYDEAIAERNSYSEDQKNFFVDFRAFAVNVKTIAPIQRLYQSRHAIWLAYHNLIQCT